MMIPLASMLRGTDAKRRRMRIWSTGVLAFVGACGVVLALFGGTPFNIPLLVFAAGAILYQWIVALIAR